MHLLVTWIMKYVIILLLLYYHRFYSIILIIFIIDKKSVVNLSKNKSKLNCLFIIQCVYTYLNNVIRNSGNRMFTKIIKRFLAVKSLMYFAKNTINKMYKCIL